MWAADNSPTSARNESVPNRFALLQSVADVKQHAAFRPLLVELRRGRSQARFPYRSSPSGGSLRSDCDGGLQFRAAGGQELLRDRPRFQIGGEQLHAILADRAWRGTLRARPSAVSRYTPAWLADVSNRITMSRGCGCDALRWRRDAQREKGLTIFAGIRRQLGRRLFRVGCACR